MPTTPARPLRFLFIQPEFPKPYVTFFPVYEPFHALLFAALIEDLAESRLFDRRFDTDANLRKVLREFKPDIVGANSHVAGELINVMRLFGIVKEECPEAVTVVGGQHATLLPEDLFDASVDLVCIGPGEETFRAVAELRAADGTSADYASIPGLAVRQGETCAFTPARLPSSGTMSWPRFDRSILRSAYKRHYFNHFEYRSTVYTITSQGCPYRCSFCSLWAAARGTYRRRKPEEIVGDIAGQPQPFVHITDDNTFHSEAHAMAIYELLKKRGIRKKILAYARTDTIVGRPHVLEKWREIGLGALVVGMEACTDRHLAAVNKRTSVDLNIQAQKVLDELGIENWAHFVIMPDFQAEDFRRVWEFVSDLQIAYPVFVPLTPVPGTPLFFEQKAAGNLTTWDYGYYTMQYMTLRTAMDKREWYDRFRGLYFKSCAPRTIWRRRKSPAFHWRPVLGRALFMGRCAYKMNAHVEAQMEHERTFNYAARQHELLPSLRSDYRPTRYFNAPTLAKAMEAAEANAAGRPEKAAV